MDEAAAEALVSPAPRRIGTFRKIEALLVEAPLDAAVADPRTLLPTILRTTWRNG